MKLVSGLLGVSSVLWSFTIVSFIELWFGMSFNIGEFMGLIAGIGVGILFGLLKICDRWF